MVGRRNTLLVTKRSLRNADSTAGKRPKRVIQTKLMEETVGMSRQEEQELNKALYASLQENRRSKSMPSLVTHCDEYHSNDDSLLSNMSNSNKNITSKSSRRSLPSGSKSGKLSLGQRRLLRTGAASPLRRLKRTHKQLRTSNASTSHKSLAKLPSSLSIDDSSQDSVRSSSSSANGSKRKIHAQRKFAQGCSLPGTPNSTPAKLATPPVKKISSRIPKTEDFLTFLCLRGTSILPPHLDFFNYSKEELPSQEGASKSGSSNKAKRQREGTPDSSSTSSGANEEVAEAAENVITPAPAGKRGGDNSLLAKRSAARASAGTPETARGIVSLRQGLQRKVSSSSSSRSSSPRFPVASTSSFFSPCQAQQASSSSKGAVLINPAYNKPLLTTRNHRPKFYFTPEKSPSPSKASGVRPGEFTPPSMHCGSLYFGSVRNFSPLVCRPSTSKSASAASTPASQQSAMVQGLYSSSSSSSYPSSSRSSWSSTATDGTPKRRRQGTIPFSREDAGKVTPVCTSTPSFSLSTHYNLIGLPFHTSLSSSSSSATKNLPFPVCQSPSSPGVLSVPQPPPPLVVGSSSAYTLGSHVAHKLPLRIDKLNTVCSDVSYSHPNGREFFHAHTSRHPSPHVACPSDCQNVPSTCNISSFLCVDSASRCHCKRVSQAQENVLTKGLKPCYGEKTSHFQQESNSYIAHSHIPASQHAPLTLYEWSACSTNKNLNSMCHCDPNTNLMHATSDFRLHEQDCHSLYNPSSCSDPCMATICFQHNPSSFNQHHFPSIPSCICPYSHKKCVFDINGHELEKECTPSDLGVHVSISCMSESHSLSGQKISTNSQQQEVSGCSSSIYSSNGQEEINSIWEQHSEKNKLEIKNHSSPENNISAMNARCSQYDKGAGSCALGDDSYNDIGYQVDKLDPRPLSAAMQERQSLNHSVGQQCLKGADFEEYDFSIIDQGRSNPYTMEDIKTLKRKRSCKKNKKRIDSATQLKRKKPKKHHRKRIKVKQAELRIPKLTIRISKKRKICTLSENDQSRHPEEKDEDQSEKQNNFQKEFIKMLEGTEVPELYDSPGDILYTNDRIWSDGHKRDDHPQFETDFLTHGGFCENPLPDYHGCISESEISITCNSSQSDYQGMNKLFTQEFHQPCILDKNVNDNNVEMHEDGDSVMQIYSEKQVVTQGDSKEVCSYLSDKGEVSVTKNLKMRDKVIEAYSKFNTRDLIRSSIEMKKKDDTNMDDLPLHFSPNQKILFGVSKEPISSNDYSCDNDKDFKSNKSCTHGAFEGSTLRCEGKLGKQHSFKNENTSCKVLDTTRPNKDDNRDESSEACLLPRVSKQSQDLQNQVSNAVDHEWSKCKHRGMTRSSLRFVRRKIRNESSKIFKGKISQSYKQILLAKKKDLKTIRKQISGELEKDGDSKKIGQNQRNKNMSESQRNDNQCVSLMYHETQKVQQDSWSQTEPSGDCVTCGQESAASYQAKSNINGMSEKEMCKVSRKLTKFEKGKSHLIDQILDWASVALTKIASNCSSSGGKSEVTQSCLKRKKPDVSIASDYKINKSKRPKKDKRNLSDLNLSEDSLDSKEYKRLAQNHVHHHRKKKRYKSKSGKRCKHCHRTKRLCTSDVETSHNKSFSSDELDRDRKVQRSNKSVRHRGCHQKTEKTTFQEEAHISVKDNNTKNIVAKSRCLQRQNACVENVDSISLSSSELMGHHRVQLEGNKSFICEEKKEGFIQADNLNIEKKFYKNVGTPQEPVTDTSDLQTNSKCEVYCNNQIEDIIEDFNDKQTSNKSQDFRLEKVQIRASETSQLEDRHSPQELENMNSSLKRLDGSREHARPEKSCLEKMLHSKQNSAECNGSIDLSAVKLNSKIATHSDSGAGSNNLCNYTKDTLGLELGMCISDSNKTSKNPCNRTPCKLENVANLCAKNPASYVYGEDLALDTGTSHQNKPKAIETTSADLFSKNYNGTLSAQHKKSQNVVAGVKSISDSEEKTVGKLLVKNKDIVHIKYKVDHNHCLNVFRSKEKENLEVANKEECTNTSGIENNNEKESDSNHLFSNSSSCCTTTIVSIVSEEKSKSKKGNAANCFRDLDTLSDLEQHKIHETPINNSLYFMQDNVTDDDVVVYDGNNEERSNNIAVHSYGSLNTGQGFAVVNGRLEQCCILDKVQVALEEKRDSERLNTLRQKSSIRSAPEDHIPTSIVQQANTQDKIEEGSTRTCISQPAEKPHLVRMQPTLTESNSSKCLVSKELQTEIQPVSCKLGPKTTSKNQKLSQCKVPEFAILYQTRPQLQRSIYLRAKDQVQKDQFKNFISLDDSKTPSDETVKVFQRNYSFESSLESEESSSKAKSRLQTIHPSSLTISPSTCGNVYQAQNHILKKWPAPDRRYKLNHNCPQVTNVCSSRTKAYSQSDPYSFDLKFPSVSSKIKCVSSSLSVPAHVTAKAVTSLESQQTSTIDCCQPQNLHADALFNQHSNSCLISPIIPLNLTSPLVNNKSKTVDILSQPSLTTHTSISTTCQPCPIIVSIPLEEHDCQEGCNNITEHASKNDKQALYHSFNMESRSQANMDMKKVSSTLNKANLKNSDRTSKTSKSCSTHKRNETGQNNTSASDTSKGKGLESSAPSVAEMSQKSKHRKMNSREPLSFTGITAINTCRQKILAAGCGFSQDTFSSDTFYGTTSKPASHISDDPAYPSDTTVDILPLDLSPTANIFSQDIAHTQKEYPFDIDLSTESLGLNIDFINTTHMAGESNEHVLDAIMAELKLQIEHLKGEILQGESRPECEQPSESLLPSSNYLSRY
ncbi:hypothetical protein RRG08_010789 [Elysia crispata]|uniref:Uncharacterized protein n=1 Tax=Elysia crispata TaxID=231223 RepID=A0AAE1E0V0_9GAST|nr:hypothetical protein RRG08_010789 [Elysia crispata]